MTKKSVDKSIEKHLTAKRNELVWALATQDYTNAQIGRIFNINRSTVLRIIEKKPSGWVTPWWKVDTLK